MTEPACQTDSVVYLEERQEKEWRILLETGMASTSYFSCESSSLQHPSLAGRAISPTYNVRGDFNPVLSLVHGILFYL